MSSQDKRELSRIEDFSLRDSPAGRFDARALAATTIVFVAVVVSFPLDAVSAMTPFVVYPAAVAAAGGIPLGFLARKVLIASPFVLALALCNPIYDSAPAAAIGPFSISGGWLSFASIVLRFVLTAAAVTASVACLGMHRFCGGLEGLGLPRFFAVQLLLLYRYIFLIAGEGSRMAKSAKMRLGPRRSLALQHYGPLAGSLMLRSFDRAERVYRAMLARGFDGDLPSLRRGNWRGRDTVFVCSWLVLFATGRAWNIAQGLGRIILRSLA